MTAPGPRITPLQPDQWDDRLSRLLSLSPGGTAEPMGIFTTLARAPELFRRWLGFGGALLAGQLPGRLRELVILRTAYRFDGRYEWAHHIELGRDQGISAEEIAALGGDLGSLPWPPLERATLAGHLDSAELVELVMLIAHYMMLSTVLRSLRVPLEPQAEALARVVPAGPPA
jgi:4-carboxymuconolactone decarboxylase